MAAFRSRDNLATYAVEGQGCVQPRANADNKARCLSCIGPARNDLKQVLGRNMAKSVGLSLQIVDDRQSRGARNLFKHGVIGGPIEVGQPAPPPMHRAGNRNRRAGTSGTGTVKIPTKHIVQA